MYLFARYYDPELGRFYALDPELGSLSMPQTLNRYVYCVNSPLIYTDPTGRAINFLAGAIGAVVGGVIGGVVTYVTSGGDLQATGAAMLGGMVTGGLAGLTMGASLIPESIGMVGAGMIIGAVSGAAGGAIERGLLAGAKSNWNAGKIIEGALYGAAVGGATGLIAGGASNLLLKITNVIPAGAKSYNHFLGKSESILNSLKTANYATKEGVVEGVNIMSRPTAESMGIALTSSGLTLYGKAWGMPIGWGVKSFTDHQISTFERFHRAHSGG